MTSKGRCSGKYKIGLCNFVAIKKCWNLVMARKNRHNYPLIEALEITTLAAEGKAMGRYNEQVVFVPMTVPGDVVDVQIRNKRRRFMEGVVVNYVKRSPLREEPFCPHFGVCGGCKWQNLPYSEQLRFKTDQVRDQLTRILSQ